jgi:hypothetical protein
MKRPFFSQCMLDIVVDTDRIRVEGDIKAEFWKNSVIYRE